MKGLQSYGQATSISQLYFAVQPLSLHFSKPHPAAFSLYFQKSLQIIAKHPSPPSSDSPNPHRFFPLPPSIAHFRMTSDKNLDYQWSIYRQRPPAAEDFIQTQKISLKNEWNSYLKNGQTVFESEVKFRNVKGKMSYLIMIGKSNQDLMEKLVPFMSDRPDIEVADVQKWISDETLGEKNPEVPKQIVEKASVLGVQADKAERQIKYNEQHAQTAVEQPPSEDPLDLGVEQAINTLSPHDPDLKLSQSQLDICEEIEQEVKQYEHKASLKAQEPPQTETIVEPLKPTTLEPTKAGSAKEITIVSSQLLNSRQEAAEPLWKNKHIVGIAILLLILVGWLLMGRTDPTGVDSIKEKRPRQSKKAQLKQQKQTKKGKTKNKKA